MVEKETKTPLQSLRGLFSFTFKNVALAVFIIAFALRLVPEIVAGTWPLGFDTITYYVPIVMRLAQGNFNPAYLDSYAPLGYFILFLLCIVSKNIFLSLKIMGTLLYGFFGLAFFFFAVKGLKWSIRKGFAASILFSMYFLSLRIGWDLYRNMLGLTFLLFLLPFLQELDAQPNSRKLIASLLLIAVVLSHEIVGIVALLITLISLVLDYVKERRSAAQTFKLALWFAPSLSTFVLIIWITAFEFRQVPGSINYFTSVERGLVYSSYAVLASDILAFFVLAFGLLLPFVAYGFWRNRTLSLWSCICLVGSFWPLFYPWFEVVPWNRWMYMLDIPFVIYAMNGLDRLHKRKMKTSINPNFHKRFLGSYLFFILIGSVTAGFVVLPQGLSPYPNFVSLERLSFYVPGGMVSNTFPVTDSESLVSSLQWVNERLDNHSVLIVHESLTGWAVLYIDHGKNVINYHFQSHQTGLQEALSAGFKRVYLIWWTDNHGWYGQRSAPEEFGPPVLENSRVGVYVYESP